MNDNIDSREALKALYGEPSELVRQKRLDRLDRHCRAFIAHSPFVVIASADAAGRAECLSWLFWQMGAAPYLGGGFGHFFKYAPEKFEYPINRYTMEAKRQMDVLDRHLAENQYMCGDDYSIADIAIWPWYGGVVLNRAYEAGEVLDAGSYKHLGRWAEEIDARECVKRGRMVNKSMGPLEEQLHERHDACDFETKTQDKIEAES